LFHRGKLGVALVDNQVQGCVADTLIGYVHNRLPAKLALVIPELNLVVRQLAILGLKLVLPEFGRVETDVLLPAVKVINPVVEVCKFQHPSPLSPSNSRVSRVQTLPSPPNGPMVQSLNDSITQCSCSFEVRLALLQKGL